VVPVREFRAEYLKLSAEPDEKYLPSAEEQAELDAAAAAKAAAAIAATVEQPSTDASAQPEEQEPEESEKPEPATNEATMLAAVAQEYARAADILRELVTHAESAES
jgi:hypothetical protein